MTRLSTRIVGLLMATVLGVSACGDDDTSPDAERVDEISSSTTSTSTTPDEDPDPDTDDSQNPDAAIARAALLRPSDLPDGWTEKPTDDAEDDVDVVDRIAECLGVEPAELTGGSATAESPTFASPGDHELSNTTAVLETEDDTIARFELAASVEYQTCLRDEVSRLLREQAVDGVVLAEPTVQEATPNNLGDEAIALRLTMPFETDGASIVAYQDVVIARVGRGVITVFSFSALSAPSGDDLAHYVRILVDRLDDALAAPPSEDD